MIITICVIIAIRYYMAIKTFGDKATAAVFEDLPAKSLPPTIRKRAQAKLAQIHNAAVLEDLKVPPGNMLEPLQGDLVGRYSIRINEQWRVCFVWQDGNAFDVEIVDYH